VHLISFITKEFPKCVEFAKNGFKEYTHDGIIGEWYIDIGKRLMITKVFIHTDKLVIIYNSNIKEEFNISHFSSKLINKFTLLYVLFPYFIYKKFFL